MSQIVPGEVFAAIMTGRSQFMAPLHHKLKAGEGLTIEEQQGLAWIVDEAIRWKIDIQQQLQALHTATENSRNQTTGIQNQLNRLLEIIENLMSA